MKRFARALAVTLGLVVLGSIVSLVSQKPAAGGGGAPVIIAGPLPLPVTPPTINQFRQRVDTSGGLNDIIVSNTTSSTLIIENIAVSDSFTTGAVFVGVNSHPAPGVTQFEGVVTVPVTFVAGTPGTNAGNLQTKIVVKPGEDLEITNDFQSVIMLTGHYEP